MSDLATTKAAIRARFKANVADALSLPTQYDNERFTQPDPSKPDAMWCKFSVQPGDSQQSEIGGNSNTYRHSGVAIASVYVPFETGEGAAETMAKNIAKEFRNLTAAGVVFRTPSTFRVGRVGPWWQINVSCPWFANESAA